MTRISGLPLLALCGLWAVLFLPKPGHAQGKTPKKKDDAKAEAKRSAERVRQYMKQLHVRFDAWDRNNDNKLSSAELALVFRGPKADPLDRLKIKLPMPPVMIPPAMVTELIPGKIRPMALVLMTWPEPALAANSVLAGMLTTPPTVISRIIPAPLPSPVKPPKVPDFTRFGDYQFLAVVNKGKDWNVSRAEFEEFAKEYAHLLDRLEEAEHDLAQAKSQLAKANNAKMKALATAQFQKTQAALQRVQAQWNGIPAAIHKELHVKH